MEEKKLKTSVQYVDAVLYHTYARLLALHNVIATQKLPRKVIMDRLQNELACLNSGLKHTEDIGKQFDFDNEIYIWGNWEKTHLEKHNEYILSTSKDIIEESKIHKKYKKHCKNS